MGNNLSCLYGRLFLFACSNLHDGLIGKSQKKMEIDFSYPRFGRLVKFHFRWGAKPRKKGDWG